VKLDKLNQLIQHGKWQEANQWVVQWETTNPAYRITPFYCYLKGIVWENIEERPIAATWWRKSLCTFPKVLLLHKGIVNFYINANFFPLASDALERAKNLFPLEDFFFTKQIELYFKLHQVERALECAIIFQTRFPKNTEGYLKSILALLKLNQLESAYDAIENWWSLLSKEEQLQIYYQLNQYNSADKLCQEAMATQPNSLYWLGHTMNNAIYIDKTTALDIPHIKKQLQSSQIKKKDILALFQPLQKYPSLEILLLELEPFLEEQGKMPSYIKKYLRTVQTIRKYETKVVGKAAIEKKVDIVYTWADMSDPAFLEKFKKANGFAPKESSNIQNNQERYEQDGEIRFSLRTVAQYFPEVNHIYIVTNDQEFDLTFLAPAFQQKITFINQASILPKEYVTSPVFNSNLIETFMWQIPNLSETFLYFCDDYFLGAPLSVEEHIFNEEGVPYANVYPQIEPNLLYLKELIRNTEDKTIYQSFYYNGYTQFLERFGSVPPVRNMHGPMILRKTACREAFQEFLPYWKESFFKNALRQNTDVFTLLIYVWLAIQKGYQKIGPYHYYIRQFLLYNHGLNEENVAILKKVRPLFFCINYLPDKKSKSLFKELTKDYLS